MIPIRERGLVYLTLFLLALYTLILYLLTEALWLRLLIVLPPNLIAGWWVIHESYEP